MVSQSQFNSDLATANERPAPVPTNSGAIRSLQNTLYSQGAIIGTQYSTSPQAYAAAVNAQRRADTANSVPTNRGAIESLQNTLYNQGAMVGPQYRTPRTAMAADILPDILPGPIITRRLLGGTAALETT